jgi:hypothetical protein
MFFLTYANAHRFSFWQRASRSGSLSRSAEDCLLPPVVMQWTVGDLKVNSR